MSAEKIVPASTPSRKQLGEMAYTDYIHELLKKRNARNYVEIGVRAGVCLAGAECPTIGVDPQFMFDRNPVGRKTALHLFQMTSDAFFARHNPRYILGESVDVAFLDGLHQFEYLLRDFINIEKHCDRNSLILLDDCLPLNIEMTERIHQPDARVDKGISGWWTGDVWKVVSILREFRPELRIVPVDARPTGSIGISNLDPGSLILENRYFEIIDRYHDLVLTADLFESYWVANKPVRATDILSNFEMSRFFKV